MLIARRELLLAGGVGMAAAAVGAVVGMVALRSRSGGSALLAESFLDLSGKPRRLAEWTGQVLVCNFWATWCAPCREEIPLLIAAQRKYAAKNVQIVGIGIDQADKMLEFSKILRIDYPILVAGATTPDTMKLLGNGGGSLPFTVFLDRHGTVARTKLGALEGPEIDRILESIIG
jgi:thiol-disulfide isomerase/thioredoxin